MTHTQCSKMSKQLSQKKSQTPNTWNKQNKKTTIKQNHNWRVKTQKKKKKKGPNPNQDHTAGKIPQHLQKKKL